MTYRLGRRASVLAIGVAAGLAGLILFASSAFACSGSVNGSAYCLDTGGWAVNWHAHGDSDESFGDADITATSAATTPTMVGQTIPAGDDVYAVSGVVEYPATQESATLTVTFHWAKGNLTNPSTSLSITRPVGCTPPPPSLVKKPYANVTSVCGAATVNYGNRPSATANATIVITASGKPKLTLTLKPGEADRKMIAFREDASGGKATVSVRSGTKVLARATVDTNCKATPPPVHTVPTPKPPVHHNPTPALPAPAPVHHKNTDTVTVGAPHTGYTGNDPIDNTFMVGRSWQQQPWNIVGLVAIALIAGGFAVTRFRRREATN